MNKIHSPPTEVLRDSSHHGDDNFRFAANILNEASVPASVSSKKKSRDHAGEAADQNVLHHRNIFNLFNPFKWFGEIVSVISMLLTCMSMICHC